MQTLPYDPTCIVLCRSCLLPSLRHHSPLRDRIIRPASSSPLLCKNASTKITLSARPSKYREWSELSMREAVNAINEQGMSVSKASVVYGIPRTTLNDHKLGKVLPGAKPGAPTLLSTSEEEDIVDFLIKSADIGYGRTRKEVLDIVSRMLACRGVDRGVTNGWWNKFLCRHPILSVRTPATLSVARARASNRETIDSYFDILEETLQETGLIDYPALYFNMDESGFALDPKSMICGEKKKLSISSGLKSQVTVIACVSATGQAIPPLIIWKRKTMTAEMAIGEIPGTQYGFSENGWTNSILFDSWFKKQFMRYAPASRPLILFLDGHSSHYCPDTINLAADNGIIIFTLPPNTTHLTQPLNKGVFGPFKQHWRRVCHDFKISHPGQVINDYNFCRLFSKAWIVQAILLEAFILPAFIRLIGMLYNCQVNLS